MKASPQEPGPIKLVQVVGMLRRRLALVVLCTLVVAAAAFAFSSQQTKEYTAAASLDFGSSNAFTQKILGLTPTGTSAQLTQQASNVELLQLGETPLKTAQKLGLSEADVRGAISVESLGESEIVAVKATAESPALAAKLANTYALQFRIAQAKANDRAYRAALALVNRQIAELPTGERFSEAAANLQNRSQTLRLLRGTNYGGVTIASRAIEPSSPSSPKTKRNVVIGGLVGLLFGLGVAFALEKLRRERWLCEEDDFEEAYGTPILGTVTEGTGPVSAWCNGSKSGVAKVSELESFQAIIGRLRLVPGSLSRQAVLLAAPTAREGTTTTALGLAEAAASIGSKVLLIDANFRDPSLSRDLGFGADVGLGDVVSGRVSLGGAVQPITSKILRTDAAGGGLSFLPKGAAIGVTPVQVFESGRLTELLAQAKNSYDLVILDVPPVTEHPDSLSLLAKADGVIVVGRLGRTLWRAAEDLRGALLASGAERLGIVVNGSTARGTRVAPSLAEGGGEISHMSDNGTPVGSAALGQKEE